MEIAILKLAAFLLKEYGNELANNGCNDTPDEVKDLILNIGQKEFQKMANNWNGDECVNAENYDWIVAKTISYKLDTMSETYITQQIEFLTWCDTPIYRPPGDLKFRLRAQPQFPEYNTYDVINETGDSVLPKGTFLTTSELYKYWLTQKM